MKPLYMYTCRVYSCFTRLDNVLTHPDRCPMKNTIPYSKPDSTLVDHVRAAIDAHKANSLLARAVRAARSVA